MGKEMEMTYLVLTTDKHILISGGFKIKYKIVIQNEKIIVWRKLCIFGIICYCNIW